MSDDRMYDLEFGIEFLDDSVVVAIGGELDLLTAAVVAGALNATVDPRHRDLIVDVGGVSFIDATGVDAFASVVQHLQPLGGTCTVRSASQLVRRVFDITDMSALVAFVEAEPSTPHGGGAHDDVPQVAGDGDQVDLAASGSGALVRSSTGVVDAALGLVTAVAASTVENADGVSVTLERHGRLMTVAASDDAVKEMDGHQYDTGEGPCLSAKAEGRWFYIESLEDEDRWPKFVPLALEQGIHSILSSPLMTKDRPQGALNIYSSKEHAFSTRDQELAALFSAQASEILTTAGPEETDDEVRQRFTSALTARQVIHQAQGVIMERNGLTAEDVAGALHRAARKAGVTVRVHAAEVVASVDRDRGAEEHR